MKDKNGKVIWKCFNRSLKILVQTNRIHLIIIILLTIILGGIPTLSIVVMKEIVNTLQNPESELFEILLAVGLYALIDIFNCLFGKILNVISFSLERKVNIETSLLVLEKTKSLELKHYENMDTYNLIQRAKNSNIVFSYFMYYLTIVKAFITILTSAIILNGWVFVVIPPILIITIIRMLYLFKIGKKKYLIYRERTTKDRKKWYYQYLLTNDLAFKEINLYNLYDYFIEKYKSICMEFYRQDNNINKKQQTVDGILLALDSIVCSVIFMVFIISCKLSQGLIGNLIAYMRSIMNIKNNIGNFCLQIAVIWENTLYISQLFELLDLDTGKEKKQEDSKVDSIDKIEFLNVNYKYKRSSEYILKEVNFVLESNEIYYLVGTNGSGKSTLIKLILGFYDDYEGNIFINGVNFRKIDKENYRNKITALMQDYMKYELTVRENVILSDLKNFYNSEKIEKILENLDFRKYETLDDQLGYWFEDGHQISGGEWMKIALARAMLREADIYILDEPDSSLDPISNIKVLKCIETMLENKIGILVTHKVSSILRHKGKIIFIDSEKRIRIGTHKKLISECKEYQDFINLKQRRESNE